jgi:integration host factor subunit alpha
VTRSVGCSRFNFDEILSTAVPSAKHCRLLASYLLNLERGPATVRDMIVVDVCDLLELGAVQQAEDLCVVLGCFLSDYPEADLAKSPCEATRIGFAAQGATGVADESRSIPVRAHDARPRMRFPPPMSLTKIGQRRPINGAKHNVQSSSMRHSIEQHTEKHPMNVELPIATDRATKTPNSVTRAALAEAVQRRLGVSGVRSVDLVDLVLNEILDVIASGEELKLRSFGSFHIHSKRERPGRNPKTGVAAPVSARRVVSFKASSVLRDQVNEGRRIDDGR